MAPPLSSSAAAMRSPVCSSVSVSGPGRRFELAGDGGMSVGERLGNLVGVGGDGFAFARQFVEQNADAALVLAIGPLEMGDFGPNHGFQLARAGQRPLDAVAHRSDFAADRLAQRHHLLGRERLGLGEADRHLGHGACGVTHFLGAAHDGAHGEEEDDRPDQGEGRERRGRAEQTGRKRPRHG